MEINQLNEKISELNLKIEKKPDKSEFTPNNAFNNFFKDSFVFENVNYDIIILLYSNVLLINLTSCNKFGIMYEGIQEVDDIDEDENNIYEVKCLIGNRKDDLSQFLANMLNIWIFNCLKNTNLIKMEKNMISISINYKNIMSETIKSSETKIENNINDKNFKSFINTVKEKVEKLFNTLNK